MACAAKADIAQGEDVGILLLLLLASGGWLAGCWLLAVVPGGCCLLPAGCSLLAAAGCRRQLAGRPASSRRALQGWPGPARPARPGGAAFSAGAGHNYAFGVGGAAV